jgi:PhoH-like ATPase
MALGKDIGFLPGTLEEKMRPWLQPYHDALEVLIPSKPPKDPQFASKKVSKKKHKNRDEHVFGPGPVPTHNGPGPGNGPLVKPYERLLKSVAARSPAGSSSWMRRSNSRRTRSRPS